MRGKVWLCISVVILIVVAVGAQSPSGSSMTVTSNTTCPAPALGLFSLCKPTSGGAVQYTDEGSAYKAVNFSGTVGPQGPAGPAGPVGPAGTMPASFSCTSVTISATGVWTLSGCK